MQTLQQRITQFISQWQYYFFFDRQQKCKPTIDSFIKEIDESLEKYKDTKKEKALLFYLRGKVLDFLSCYQKSAEQYLNKSIKLNPVNGDCWNCLAHVLYKKKDYQGSQKAVEMALQNVFYLIKKKGKNKISLRYQSILLRNQGTNLTQKSKNVQESIKLAKQAIMLDMKDPETWYFLGNAYMNNFFVNFKKVQQLENAIKAYNEAEKYFKHRYPDLFFNRASAQCHLEEYENAIKDFKQADEIDPDLRSSEKIETLRKRLDYFRTCFQRANELKPEKIQQLIKNIPNSIKQKQTVKIVPLSNLTERYNPSKMLSVKVVNKLTMDNDIPESFLVIDSSGKFLCLSIYNANSVLLTEKIKKDTLIQVKDPELKKIKFGQFEYWSVQVFELVNVWVNGSKLTKNQFVPNLIVNTSVQKTTEKTEEKTGEKTGEKV